MFKQMGIAWIVTAAVSANVWAFNLNDITQWVGSGSSEAALVIDFNDSSTQPVRVWGYRFDGSPTAWDMLLAVLATDTNLHAKADTLTQYGPALFGIGYDVDGDGFAINPAVTFDANGMHDTNTHATTTESTSADGASAVDGDDQYEEGWFYSGFWLHYTSIGSPYDGASWSSAFGLVSQTLGDDSWTGLSFDALLSFDHPPGNPVPEPASLAVLAIGAAGLIVRRRTMR